MAKHGHNKGKKGTTQGWNSIDSKIKPDTAPMNRISLNPADFTALVEQHGVNVKVYRSGFCPRVKSVDGNEHDINCPICNGSGFVDLYPLCTKAFIQSQDLEKRQSTEGLIDGNHVSATFHIGVELQYFTRVDLMDYTDLYMETIMRKKGSLVDAPRYKACRVNFCVDYNGKEYFQDSDFTLDINGNIKWGTRRPADGMVYSINYETPTQFRATRALHVNRFAQAKSGPKVEFIKMNEQWILSKEYLVRRKDRQGEDIKLGPYDDHEEIED